MKVEQVDVLDYLNSGNGIVRTYCDFKKNKNCLFTGKIEDYEIVSGQYDINKAIYNGSFYGDDFIGIKRNKQMSKNPGWIEIMFPGSFVVFVPDKKQLEEEQEAKKQLLKVMAESLAKAMAEVDKEE